MKPEDRDSAHLWDMLNAAREARELVAGIDYDGLMSDFRARLALERALEIIGEAARRVSQPLRDRHPEIPWAGIIGLRNAIAHQYGEIDHRRLHTVATNGVPKLIVTLEEILGPDPEA